MKTKRWITGEGQKLYLVLLQTEVLMGSGRKDNEMFKLLNCDHKKNHFMIFRENSYFSEECESLESPGSPLPVGTTWPGVEDFHGPCTPRPPPDPQRPEHPADAAQQEPREQFCVHSCSAKVNTWNWWRGLCVCVCMGRRTLVNIGGPDVS